MVLTTNLYRHSSTFTLFHNFPQHWEHSVKKSPPILRKERPKLRGETQMMIKTKKELLEPWKWCFKWTVSYTLTLLMILHGCDFMNFLVHGWFHKMYSTCMKCGNILFSIFINVTISVLSINCCNSTRDGRKTKRRCK